MTISPFAGFLRRVGQRDILFKPVPSVKGPREVHFYKNVFGSHFSEVPKEVIALKELVPKYYGTHDIVDRAGTLRILIGLEGWREGVTVLETLF